MFQAKYSDAFTGNDTWNRIPVSDSKMYAWDSESTYIQEPPFFDGLTPETPPIQEIRNARVLALLGDSVTTDHISPAGAIPADGPAGRYLIEHDVQPRDFNSFGSRRGNDRVMTRGTFGNIRLKNLLVPGVEGGVTIHLPDNNQMSIYAAAMKYRSEGVPLIVLGGAEYGSGSSRDWAAKGTLLLGIKAVIVESFERIHRSNLIGMGVLPLQFMAGDNAEILGLSGHEVFDILNLGEDLQPSATLKVHAKKDDGAVIKFQVLVRIDTPTEIEYYRNGGILHTVIRKMLEESS